MKNLILCAIASLFLFTSCFEKEEEVTVISEEEIEVAPVEEGNIMECEMVIKFIEEMQSVDPPNNPEEPRATIDKYTFDNKIVYMLMTPSSYFTDILPVVIDSHCNIVCQYSQIDEYNTCDDLNVQEVKFVESTWVDNR